MVSKLNIASFRRPAAKILQSRLREEKRFIQVVAGSRQVGKTTLVQQVLDDLRAPCIFASADEPALRGNEWIVQQWEAARLQSKKAGKKGFVLALDEIQKIAGWSETVKRLWDEDKRRGINTRIVILGSAALLVQKGLTESLAGRFEIIHLPHWTFAEMRDAFGVSLEEYIYFGGYPGAATLIDDPPRWARYVKDSLIETTISKDILLVERVDKPALFRRLFELACLYSGQVLSYQKMVGQLQDAGNTTTLAHYLDLLAGSGIVTGLQKYSGSRVRRRGSSPKLQVLNTAFMTVMAGISPAEFRTDSNFRGRIVESAIGAHLANAAASGCFELFYWREGNREVDFVIKAGRHITAIEVKSGRRRDGLPGMAAFAKEFPTQRHLLVGGDGIPVEEFLVEPALSWIKP